ncbi:MAG: carboxypeptidase-like regulatory domain-containing protein [Planctomycetota bacterium]
MRLRIVLLISVISAALVGLFVGLHGPPVPKVDVVLPAKTEPAAHADEHASLVDESVASRQFEAPVASRQQPTLAGEVELDPEALWTGRVTGSRSGTNVVVHLEWLSPERSRRKASVYDDTGTNWTRAKRLASSPLDADGVFRVPAVRSAPANSKLRLRAEAPWLADAEQTYLVGEDSIWRWPAGQRPDEEPVVLRGVEAGVLVVRFECSDGWTEAERASLAGRPVVVRRRRNDAPATVSFETYDTFARASADGTVRFEALRPGQYDLIPAADTSDPAECLAPFWAVATEPLEVRAGETSNARAELRRGVFVHGIVRTDDGAPAPGAVVSFESTSRGLRYLRRVSLATSADAEGRFVQSAARAPLISISASLLDHRTVTLDGDALVEALADPDGIDLRLERGRTLRGRIVHSDGRPAAGIGVQFALPDDSARFGHLRAASDEDGRFEIHALSAGRVELSIAKAEIDGVEYSARATAVVTEADTEPTCTLVLRESRTIRGRVVDPDGAPLDDVHVFVGSLDRIGHPASFARRTSTLGATPHPVEPIGPGEATFEIADVGANAIGMWAQIGRRTAGRSSPLFVLDEPLKAGDVELVLLRGSSIRGAVLDDKGDPVPGAEVELFAARQHYDESRRKTSTAEDGSFAFGGVEDGDYRVAARTESLLARGRVDVAVERQRSAPEIVRIEVESGGRVMVSVDLDRGSGLRVGEPHLIRADGTYARYPSQEAGFDRDEWSLAPVLGGEYVLAVPLGPPGARRRSPAWATSTLLRPIVVAPGEATRVTFDVERELSATVRGSVRDANGEALRDYRVEVRRGDLVVARATTDWDGAFECSFPPSPGTVAELLVGYPKQLLRSVDLPHGSSVVHEVDWVVPTASVKGTLDQPDIQHQAVGTTIDLVPAGADASRHVPERSIQWMRGSGFRFQHVAPGTYTLVGWRRGPNDGVRGRTQPATRPQTIEVQEGRALEGVVLELLPDSVEAIDRR